MCVENDTTDQPCPTLNQDGSSFDGECDCSVYNELSRKLTVEENEIERLLEDIEGYEDWQLADKKKYHEFMIREFSKFESGGEE
jgi:hypothetical protein